MAKVLVGLAVFLAVASGYGPPPSDQGSSHSTSSGCGPGGCGSPVNNIGCGPGGCGTPGVGSGCGPGGCGTPGGGSGCGPGGCGTPGVDSGCGPGGCGTPGGGSGCGPGGCGIPGGGSGCGPGGCGTPGVDFGCGPGGCGTPGVDSGCGPGGCGTPGGGSGCGPGGCGTPGVHSGCGPGGCGPSVNHRPLPHTSTCIGGNCGGSHPGGTVPSRGVGGVKKPYWWEGSGNPFKKCTPGTPGCAQITTTIVECTPGSHGCPGKIQHGGSVSIISGGHSPTGCLPGSAGCGPGTPSIPGGCRPGTPNCGSYDDGTRTNVVEVHQPSVSSFPSHSTGSKFPSHSIGSSSHAVSSFPQPGSSHSVSGSSKFPSHSTSGISSFPSHSGSSKFPSHSGSSKFPSHSGSFQSPGSSFPSHSTSGSKYPSHSSSGGSSFPAHSGTPLGFPSVSGSSSSFPSHSGSSSFPSGSGGGSYHDSKPSGSIVSSVHKFPARDQHSSSHTGQTPGKFPSGGSHSNFHSASQGHVSSFPSQSQPGLPFIQGSVNPHELRPISTGVTFNGMNMMMMPMGMSLLGGTCSAGSFCVEVNTCNPYNGFIIRSLDMVPAVVTGQPQVPLVRCFVPAGGISDGVCCQEPHPIAGGAD